MIAGLVCAVARTSVSCAGLKLLTPMARVKLRARACSRPFHVAWRSAALLQTPAQLLLDLEPPGKWMSMRSTCGWFSCARSERMNCRARAAVPTQGILLVRKIRERGTEVLPRAKPTCAWFL